MIIEINSIDLPEVQVYSRLTEAQLRNALNPEEGVFIAESPKVIKTALSAGYTPLSLLCEQKHILGDAADIIAQHPDLPVYTGSRDLLASLTGYTLTRGVLCAMRRPAPRLLTEVVEGARRVCVLQGVCDTTNIGAIFRSAAALGIDAVVLSDDCCDPLNRRAIRVSMGSVFLVPWCFASSQGVKFSTSPIDTVKNCIPTGVKFPTSPTKDIEYLSPAKSLQQLGFKTVAMALRKNSIDLDDPILADEPRLAIVMGTEGDGLPESEIDNADYVVKIPMAHGVDSLNVAAASAVAFWQLRAR